MVAASAMEHGIASLSFEVPLRVDFSLDWRVLGVTLLVAVAAGVIAGLAPALYARRADVNTLLKTGGRREGAERGRLRGLLVVAQIAVSLVLLIVGGLFVKTLERARNADVGFRSDHVLMARVDLSRDDVHDGQRRRTTATRAIASRRCPAFAPRRGSPACRSASIRTRRRSSPREGRVAPQDRTRRR